MWESNERYWERFAVVAYWEAVSLDWGPQFLLVFDY